MVSLIRNYLFNASFYTTRNDHKHICISWSVRLIIANEIGAYMPCIELRNLVAWVSQVFLSIQMHSSFAGMAFLAKLKKHPKNNKTHLQPSNNQPNQPKKIPKQGICFSKKKNLEYHTPNMSFKKIHQQLVSMKKLVDLRKLIINFHEWDESLSSFECQIPYRLFDN